MAPEHRLSYAVLIQALVDASKGVPVDVDSLMPWALVVEVPRGALVDTLRLAAAGTIKFNLPGARVSRSSTLLRQRRERRLAAEACQAGAAT